MNLITIPAIIKAVQQLQQQVEALSREVVELKSRKEPANDVEIVEPIRRGRPRKE